MDNTTNSTSVSKVRGGDFFLQLGAFGALYASLVALLILLFRVIDTAFPPLSRGGYSYFLSSNSISFQVATLIVFFPLYLVLSSIIQKIYAADPARRESRIRRGLIYLTLFISGFVMAGDLVTVIYSYLNGDNITAGFVLKVISVLVVFGCIFLYYLQDVRNKLTTQTRNGLRVLSILIVLGSIIWGFAVIGSPMTQKNIKLDQQKVSDLQMIQSQVISHYQSKGALPQSLSAMQNSLSYYNLPKDPQTGMDYEYKVTGAYTFDLCATFNKAMPTNAEYSYAYRYGSDANSNWQYSAGHYCFSRTLDPQLYPVYPNYGVPTPVPPTKI